MACQPLVGPAEVRAELLPANETCAYCFTCEELVATIVANGGPVGIEIPEDGVLLGVNNRAESKRALWSFKSTSNHGGSRRRRGCHADRPWTGRGAAAGATRIVRGAVAATLFASPISAAVAGQQDPPLRVLSSGAAAGSKHGARRGAVGRAHGRIVSIPITTKRRRPRRLQSHCMHPPSELSHCCLY